MVQLSMAETILVPNDDKEGWTVVTMKAKEDKTSSGITTPS